jgi:hypothetical protein
LREQRPASRAFAREHESRRDGPFSGSDR